MSNRRFEKRLRKFSKRMFGTTSGMGSNSDVCIYIINKNDLSKHLIGEFYIELLLFQINQRIPASFYKYYNYHYFKTNFPFATTGQGRRLATMTHYENRKAMVNVE